MRTLIAHFALLFVGVLTVCSPHSASYAQTPSYQIERVASGLRQPVYMDQAPGDPSNIIYYMTRVTSGGANASNGTHGSIWRYDMNTRASTEVLNLSHRNLTLDLGPQGFAFHPDFNNPGTSGYQKMYVSSAATGGPVNYVEEYALSEPDGTVPVDGGSGEPLVSRTLLEYDNVFGDNNHVIDWIGFDPRAYSAPIGSPERDYLFISAGDGSNNRSAPDRPEQKSNNVQGKLLRISVDPNEPDFYPADPQKNFAIPDSNPIPLWNANHGPTEQLVGTTLNYTTGPESYTPALPELYFTGTRNTFRMSMDRLTGDFYSGDVGEVEREEINFAPADPYDGSQPPLDFGFPQREGTGNFISQAQGDTTIQWNLSGGGTVTVDSINPIQEGDHEFFNNGSSAGDVEIRSTPRSAYIGGYMYRGPVEELQGQYFYADFVQGNIFSLDFDADTPLGDFSGTNLNLETIPGEVNQLARLGTREVVLNRNLDSLWHTLMVDPQDPTYTADLGSSFGIGRVVSFGEDNQGNLYIIDMGGVRGNAGFGNDYPGTDSGQIFRVTPLLGITLTIDRDTGAVTLTNNSGSPIDLTGYTLSSPGGAINLSEILSISGNYDVPNPPGDGSVDDNDSWQITSSSSTLFSESTTGDEGTLATGASIALGANGAWVKSLFEDWSLQVDVPGGSTLNGVVQFVGNGDQPFARSDLSFANGIGPEDWFIFKANHFQEFPGMSAAESYQFGDLDGDGDNDFADFRLFQSDYIAVHGVEGFQALFVPEPTTAMLALSGVLMLATRRQKRHTQEQQSRPQWSHLRPRTVVLAVLVSAISTTSARAALKHQYTFNQGIQDSVGNADGTLFGNATTSALGELLLPGGMGDFLSFDPTDIGISTYTDLTFETWFTVDTHQTWARLFDYGDRDLPGNEQGYMYYAPQSGFGGNPALARYTTLGDQINATHGSPQTGLQNHLAFVIDDDANGGADQMRIYLNGNLVNSLAHNKSLSDVVETNAFLGKSTVPGDVDPYFNGSINEFRIYDHAFTLTDVQTSIASGPTPLATLSLEVNTVSGAVSIVTDDLTPTTIDYYAIRSPQNALNVNEWQSLDSQGVDVLGGLTGQSWDEADSIDSSVLGELFLLGGSEVVDGAPLSLGKAFNPAVFGLGEAGDLTFEVGIQGGGSIEGNVVYVTPTLPDGDYDGDLDVDGQDFLRWQRGLSFDPLSAGDLETWQTNYGNVGSPLSSATVPEPTTAIFAVLASCALAFTRL